MRNIQSILPFDLMLCNSALGLLITACLRAYYCSLLGIANFQQFVHKVTRHNTLLCNTAHVICRHAFLEPISSAKELFTGPYRREGVQDHEMLEIFAATGHNDCEPQRPGFNTQCRDGNRARWGYCNNIPCASLLYRYASARNFLASPFRVVCRSQGCQIHDADDADAVIGIGIEGQNCCPMGAGW